ncbi:hypothetical protein LEP1GSC021_0950 [Leptospira noguchii str. 1993005606]|uniref:Uncharacterized protein n=1 Tax=Leptospira noguchii str. 2007001578 TaxID=1049974 RepID=A0ABN0J2A1_9LEPT|nr:hypothetical protein LEP1GSC035_3793 [Leptospira noguchii str. 2007001578]EPE82848.1 hypothetical protein LEP1GSC021_0950 [Leptospira noguchii str. 1993005606]
MSYSFGTGSYKKIVLKLKLLSKHLKIFILKYYIIVFF